MNQDMIHFIMQRMGGCLDNRQLVILQGTLNDAMKQSESREITESPEVLLQAFLASKQLEGRSERTIRLYDQAIRRMMEYSDKHVCVMNTEDIRDYLAWYRNEHGVSRSTLDCNRRMLSSFFRWLEEENHIYKSPLRRIHKIKTTMSVRETYVDEDLEKLRDSCMEIRDLAIIDLLYSTGMRVGELVNLNRIDVDFDQRECIVLGKGDKERIVYFDAKTKIHLRKYLKTRTDSNPALFVSIRFPYNRLLSGGVEKMLKKMGEQCSIPHVHPHKFRRTMATAAIDKGMPIEQVQKLLGHEQINTTLRYAMVKQSNVKWAHKKYVG